MPIAHATVALIDYGTGNIASLEMAVAACSGRAFLASSPQDLEAADAVILPGVGHFGSASHNLETSGLRQALLQFASQGMPMLGICLGFQLLTAASEEDPAATGLALLPSSTVRLRPRDSRIHKVPHLGWNSLDVTGPEPFLLRHIPPQDRLFYFANAYAIPPQPDLAGDQALYRHESPWLALVQQGTLCGVQFHPEKSRSQGLQVLRNFLSLPRASA